MFIHELREKNLLLQSNFLEKYLEFIIFSHFPIYSLGNQCYFTELLYIRSQVLGR